MLSFPGMSWFFLSICADICISLHIHYRYERDRACDWNLINNVIPCTKEGRPHSTGKTEDDNLPPILGAWRMILLLPKPMSVASGPLRSARIPDCNSSVPQLPLATPLFASRVAMEHTHFSLAIYLTYVCDFANLNGSGQAGSGDWLRNRAE